MTDRLDPWEIYAEGPADGVGSPVALGAMTNVEGAPTLVYEVWDWHYTNGEGSGKAYDFIGYRTLSKRQVLRYRDFGYTVLQSRRAHRDSCGTAPLFPVVGTSGEYPADGMDQVPVPEP